MMKKVLLGFLAGGALMGSVQASQAVSVTFAQFTQSVTANQFQYTATPGNPDLINPATLTGVTSSIPVIFQFNSFLNGELAGNNANLFTGYAAHLTFLGNATTGESSAFSQNNNFDGVTFNFVADNTAANIAAGIAGKVLLSGSSGSGVPLSANAGTLSASDGASSATYKASNANGGDATTGNMVTYSSQVIDTTALNTQNYALSFSSVVPQITYDFNAVTGTFPRYLESFSASGTGTFAATFTPVPEPGTYALAGSLLVGGVFSLRRRRNRK